MSSVSGLKAESPYGDMLPGHIAVEYSFEFVEHYAFLSFVHFVDGADYLHGQPFSSPVRISARTSLGKQEPP